MPPLPTRRSIASPRVLSAERLNTLGLGPRELTALLDMLDASDGQKHNARREFARWPFRETSLNVRFIHPGGSTTTLRLAGRNISRGGVSLLHNGFVHTGTKCLVELPSRAGGLRDVAGVVARCQHRRGMLHEIGIRFNKQVNLREYVRTDGDKELLSMECVAPQKLSGTILHVEDNDLDTRIVGHFLREAPVKLLQAPSGAEALAKASSGIDLMLVDYQLPDMTGLEFARTVRQRGITCPVIMLSANPSACMADGLWEIRGMGLLPKPYTQDELLRVLGERLLLRDEGDGGANQVHDVMKASAPQLRAFADRLDAAVKANDLSAAKDAATQLHGSAASLGLAHVSTAARVAFDLLPSLRSLADNPRVFIELAAACRRAAA
ncbi:MAG: hypothetical protein HBSAPP03_10750 [Phycisphaerae bacterium]|nr:MAG: hypothetical protein HBSAPP03_10750 [Phycisphaerae bacterium]